MFTIERHEDPVDWSLTTWEGARREQLRRWAKLPLERIVAAQEEMAEISLRFAHAVQKGHSNR